MRGTGAAERLIKIDAEGYEDQVVAGMQAILKASRPTLIVECLPDGPFRSIEKLLQSHQYRFFRLQRPNPMPMDRIVPDDYQTNRNFLCVGRADLAR